MLARDGVIAVWAYGINEVEGEAVNELVQDYYSNVVGPYWPPERKLVEEGYRTIAFPFDEITPPVFRMEANWTLDELLGYFSTWSATYSFIKTNGRNPLEPLGLEMARVWGDRETPRLVTWPLSLRVGRRRANTAGLADCSTRQAVCDYDFMNSSRSALIMSACVVGMPCGKPG